VRAWPDDLPETMPELCAWIEAATPERILDHWDMPLRTCPFSHYLHKPFEMKFDAPVQLFGGCL
jgi:hypothetical protein